MELELFRFIEEASDYYQLHAAAFEYSETVLRQYFQTLSESMGADLVQVYSRVKSRESFREKLLRNKLYLDCETPEDALSQLSDLVGITMECRFIRNETEIYERIFREFSELNEDGLAISLSNPDILLNLGMAQPQLQRNGFAIYRLDGKYRFNNRYINFELQIKSLVHRFWSEIEHEVVYKNPDMVWNDRFMKKMLSSIRDSLDVVDHQLETVYTEMLMESREARIGMDERTFKSMVSSSLNELLIHKMKESVGFSTSFKADSEMLAQYFYITEFLRCSHNEVKMIEFLEALTELKENPLDFREQLVVTNTYTTGDPFEQVLSEYFLSVMNVDFEWHAFFTILSALQSGDVHADILRFTSVIGSLLIQPKWYSERFSAWSETEAEETRDYLKACLARGMASSESIHMIHEAYLLDIMNYFWTYVEQIEASFPDYEEYRAEQEKLGMKMIREIRIRLRKQKA
ncbi:MAG: hypothetical protein IJ225_07905 [Solobacterium sp.]|nr:hypothetical protein [Solobacterium sp.]